MENNRRGENHVGLDRELEFVPPAPAVYRFDLNHQPLLTFCQQLADQLNERVRIIVEFVYCVDSLDGQFYWPCRVLELEGYQVHLKFESADGIAQSFWAHILCGQIFPAGFSVDNQIPPRKPHNCFIGPETVENFIYSKYVGEPPTFPSGLQKIRRNKLIGPARRALNPLKWTCQDLKKFLQLNNYWGSELLEDVLCGFTGQELITLTEAEVQRRMRHVQDPSFHVSSLVNLINYLRALNWSNNYNL